ncbi:uncharacterized protein LOC122243440 isoform X5 [Penaeus japonicus]|uniref:uncharacterized protein LOC122243440 isoform X5 n=1 Tax=Penaeus japonicus TaxID=27405 RepID=UPI001C711100|nr:uncharacterized protein LOC122243440 isoform X5 [Penaeus japonicus]
MNQRDGTLSGRYWGGRAGRALSPCSSYYLYCDSLRTCTATYSAATVSSDCHHREARYLRRRQRMATTEMAPIARIRETDVEDMGNGSNNPSHGVDDGLGGGFDGNPSPGPRNGSGPTPGRGRGGYAPVPTDPAISGKPVMIGITLIFIGRYNVREEAHAQKADRLNNWVVLGVFLITIVNVFISSFAIEPLEGIDPVMIRALTDKTSVEGL